MGAHKSWEIENIRQNVGERSKEYNKLGKVSLLMDGLVMMKRNSMQVSHQRSSQTMHPTAEDGEQHVRCIGDVTDEQLLLSAFRDARDQEFHF